MVRRLSYLLKCRDVVWYPSRGWLHYSDFCRVASLLAMRVWSKVLLLIKLLVLCFKNRKNRTESMLLPAPCLISKDVLGIMWWFWAPMRNACFFCGSRRQRSETTTEALLQIFSDWQCTGRTWKWDRSTVKAAFFFLNTGFACVHKFILIRPAATIECPDELRIQSFCSVIHAKEP